MTFEADILDDCDIFDGVMTGTLTLLDGTTQSVSHVTRSKLTAKQTAQMGPVGVDDEIENFSLPVEHLDGEVPVQDCFWTDANSVKWKILSVERRTLSTRYLCMCVRTRVEYVAPIITVPGAQSATEDTNKSITGISIEDAKSYPQTVVLSVTNGALTLASTTGLTFTVGDGTADATMTFSGSLANVNTAIATVTYIPTANYNGSATLTISTNDGNSGTDSETVAITVAAVNDAPVVTTSGGTTTFTEGDQPVVIDSGVTVTDGDSANLASAIVRITVNLASGSDILTFVNANGITGSYDSSVGILQLTGSSSVANYQAALQSITYHTIAGNPISALKTVRFTVNDGALGSNNATKNVNVVAVP